MSSVNAITKFIESELKLTKEADGAILMTYKEGGSASFTIISDMTKPAICFCMATMQSVVGSLLLGDVKKD
jgi:hypothetical protein